MALTLYILCG